MGRYVALDGLRGVAAVVVVLTRFHNLLPSPDRAHSGYLAVDFFFLLSGFVIANAYDERLAKGLGVLAFLKIRLIRLYPLYFLAMLLPISKGLYGLWSGQSQTPPSELFSNIGFGLLILPSPTTVGQDFTAITPLNLPAWSLVLELAANILFAASFHALRRPRQLGAMVVGSAVALVAAVLVNGSAFMGFVWDSVLFGVPRVLFSFFLGVWLMRRRIAILKKGESWYGAAVPALIVLLIVDPLRFRPIYDLTLPLVVFPTILIVSSAIRLDGTTRRLSLLLGDASYAIYVFHFPLLTIAALIAKRIRPDFQLSDWSVTLCLVSLILFCLALDRLYDRPIRRLLTTRLLMTAASSDAEPARVPACRRPDRLVTRQVGSSWRKPGGVDVWSRVPAHGW